MSLAARPRCAVFFLMIFALGVSLGLPAEDVLDGAYDESEAVPYEVIPGLSIVLAQTLAGRAEVQRSHISVPSIESPTKCCRLRSENNAAHPIFDSLVILDRSFRC